MTRPVLTTCLMLFAMLRGDTTCNAQDRMPSVSDIAAAIAAYRVQWDDFSVRYVVTEHWGDGEERVDRTYDCLEAWQSGKRYLDRRITRRSGGGQPEAHERMCFDGERTFSIHVLRDRGHPDGVLIVPGLDERFIDVESPRSALAAWLYESKRPLDEVMTDSLWTSRSVEPGETINGLRTFLVRLSARKGAYKEEWRYWIAPERGFLPIRREVAFNPAGETEIRTIDVCEVLDMKRYGDAGWFPTHIRWRWPGIDEPRAELRVEHVSFASGTFEKLYADLVVPPASVNDVSRNEIYQLLDDRQRREFGREIADADAAKVMVEYLRASDPEIDRAIRAHQAAASDAARRPAPSGNARRTWTLVGVGGVVVVLSLTVVVWRRRVGMGGS